MAGFTGCPVGVQLSPIRRADYHHALKGAGLRKLAKIAAIIGLTLAGLLGLLALYGVVIEALVPTSLLGDGRANVGTWDSGYVSTMGTWAIDQERHMSPLNASEIRCYRDQRECYEAQASLFSGLSHSRLGALSDQQVGRIKHRVQQQFAVRDLHLCDRPGDAEAKRQTLEEECCYR